jgi:hypothetical protein
MSAVLKPEPMARLLPCSLEDYFRDPCETPSLSQSAAHVLITQSPAHCWTAHPRFGNAPRKVSKAADEGSLIHQLLLGKSSEILVVEANDFKTKAAQFVRDEAIAAGKIPVIASRYHEVQAAANVLRATIEGFGIDLSEGVAEQPVEWYEPADRGWVLCRGLLDLFQPKRPRIVDLKKIVSADIETCSRHAYEYGYDLQRAAYVSCVEKLMPEFAGRVEYVIVFMEIEPPYAVVPVIPNGQMRELGERRWQRAVRLWEKCLAEDYWPTYTSTITSLELPPWAITKEQYLHGDL